MSVEDCVALIRDGLTQEYSVIGDNNFAIAHSYPARFLADSRVGLWAQALGEESVVVNILLPGIRSFFSRLATYGVGYSDEYRGVRYKFVQTNLNSGTTTPISSL